MYRGLALLGLVVVAPGCARFIQMTPDLYAWEAAKMEKFSECREKGYKSREAARACLGDDYRRDFGTPTCANVDAWIMSLEAAGEYVGDGPSPAAPEPPATKKSSKKKK